MPKLKACSYYLFAKTHKGELQKPAKKLGAFNLDVRDDEPIIIVTNESGETFNIYDPQLREFNEAGVLLEGYIPIDSTLSSYFHDSWLVVPISVGQATLKRIEVGEL